jgi:hypothetical protein
MSDALKFNKTTAGDTPNFKYTFVTADVGKSSANLTETDKKKLATEAKKLAKSCCCNDEDGEDYGCWIADKFSKFTKNTEAIFFVNGRKKSKDASAAAEYKESYAVGVKVKKANADKFKDMGIKVPAMCDQAPEGREDGKKSAIPMEWKSGEDNLFVTIGGKDGASNFKLLQQKPTRKIKFCFKDMLQAQLFLLSEIFVKIFGHSDFIVNTYMNKRNYLLLERTGMIDLKLRYQAPKPVHLRLNGIAMELPVDCDYLKMPKASKDCVRNMVMYPEIENFYIENENLIGQNNCQTLRDISNIYDIAQRKSGFFFSCSSDYYISQFKVSQVAISFAADFESLESLIKKNTASAAVFDTNIIAPLFKDKKPFLITKQSTAFATFSTPSVNGITEQLTEVTNKDKVINEELEKDSPALLVKETTLQAFLLADKKQRLTELIKTAEALKTNADSLIAESTQYFAGTGRGNDGDNVLKAANDNRDTAYTGFGYAEYDAAEKSMADAKSKPPDVVITVGSESKKRFEWISEAKEEKTGAGKINANLIAVFDTIIDEKKTKVKLNAAIAALNIATAAVTVAVGASITEKLQKAIAEAKTAAGSVGTNVVTATTALITEKNNVITAYTAAEKEFTKAKILVEKLKIETERVTKAIVNYDATKEATEATLQKDLVIAYKTAADNADK